MKNGGQVVYYGPLGQHSSKVIEYFEVSFSTTLDWFHLRKNKLIEHFLCEQSIPGVPKIQKNCNPATWMLDITCKSAEEKLGIDFAQVYKDSTLYK